MSDHLDQETTDMLNKHNLMSLFEELSFRQRVRKIAAGLRAPKESGENKYARLQMMRLSAPISAVIVPLMMVFAIAVFAKMKPLSDRQVEVQIIEPEALDILEEIEELENEPLEPPEPIDMEFTPDVTVSENTPTPSPQLEFSPVPASFDSVAIVKSPVIMKGIFGSRTGGARGVALKTYGGSKVTEGAVLRALRWLKKYQEPNGSWTEASGLNDGNGAHPHAMTAFGLLTFLAHGETPSSDEFGETVAKAIRWLVDNQRPGGRLGGSYEHQISSYALSEAFALTKIPMIKDAAEPAVNLIVVGQNPYGGWNYPLLATDQRSDLSVMAWCVQALKAAKMAEMNVPGLEDCMHKTVSGVTKNWDEQNGGFGYATEGPDRGTGASGLTGAGILSMQFLGAGKEKETKAALEWLDLRRPEFNWDNANWSQIYYWYYDTQARFHAGGRTWKLWNDMFAPRLVKAQTIVKGAGIDGHDIGYWNPDKKGDDGKPTGHGAVMNTSLCALMLQVYYRYLPTYKPPLDAEEIIAAPEQQDVEVEIIL